MRRTMIPVFLCIVLFMSSGFASPSFDDFNGNKRSIEDFTGNGKWLVVMIWAHDCHVCNQEAHQYVAFHNKHKDKDAVILGLSIDGQAGKAKAEAFIKRHRLSFPNVLGEAEQVITMVDDLTGESNFATPSFLVYNPQGKLLAQQTGAVPPALIEKFMQQEAASTQ